MLQRESRPHKKWTSLKSALFDLKSFLPPLRYSDGKFLHKPLNKAFRLLSVFDKKQCVGNVDSPPTCHLEPLINRFVIDLLRSMLSFLIWILMVILTPLVSFLCSLRKSVRCIVVIFEQSIDVHIRFYSIGSGMEVTAEMTTITGYI